MFFLRTQCLQKNLCASGCVFKIPNEKNEYINATAIFFIFWKVCYILSLLESFLALLCSVLPCGAWNSQPPQCVHLNNSISHYFKSLGVLKAELSGGFVFVTRCCLYWSTQKETNFQKMCQMHPEYDVHYEINFLS